MRLGLAGVLGDVFLQVEIASSMVVAVVSEPALVWFWVLVLGCAQA